MMQNKDLSICNL